MSGLESIIGPFFLFITLSPGLLKAQLIPATWKKQPVHYHQILKEEDIKDNRDIRQLGMENTFGNNTKF